MFVVVVFLLSLVLHASFPAFFAFLISWFDSRFAKPPFYALVSYPFSFSMASDLPPPPEPTVAQILALVMEDRETARAERTATLATLQHLAQLCAVNAGNNAAIMRKHKR